MVGRLNTWNYSQFFGKTTGQDVVNIDMLWNHKHLGWYYDYDYVLGGSWWGEDGVDPFWEFAVGVTYYNTSQA